MLLFLSDLFARLLILDSASLRKAIERQAAAAMVQFANDARA